MDLLLIFTEEIVLTNIADNLTARNAKRRGGRGGSKNYSLDEQLFFLKSSS